MLASFFARLRPFRGKQRLLPALVALSPGRATRSYYGVHMMNNARDSTWRASVAGAYGDFISNYIRSIDAPFRFLDIGANQGVFTLLAATNPNCRAVIAVEPNQDTFGFLASNVRLSPNRAKIHPFCGAVVEGETRPIDMTVPERHSGAASLNRRFESRSVRDIRTLGLGAHLVSQLCAIKSGEQIHAKIDVEGAEAIVLSALESAGVFELLSSLVIEVSERVGGAGHQKSLLQSLERAGFTLSAKSRQGDHYDAIFVRTRSY